MASNDEESIKHIIKYAAPCDLPYICERIGFSLDAAISLYYQINQYPKRSGRPPSQFNNLKDKYFECWQYGCSVIDIASWLGRFPTAILKLVLEECIGEAAIGQKKLAPFLMTYPMYVFVYFRHNIPLAKRLWHEIYSVIYLSDLSSPITDRLRRHLGEDYEYVSLLLFLF